MRPQELAERTGTAPRYVEEWLRTQAAGGYVTYDAGEGTYGLTEEQAFVLTDPDGPVYAPGAFELALATLRAEPEITRAFRTGEGLGWHEHDAGVFTGCERFFRPGYVANLAGSWLPALDGVVAAAARRRRGVADVGCGHGASTILMAQEFPRATFVGSDVHEESVAAARVRAKEAGVEDRVDFEVASAQSFAGEGYDLVTTSTRCTTWVTRSARRATSAARLAPEGTWMIVEPYAGAAVAENLNPVGRVYYGFSTFLCVPNALSQTGGYALGRAGRRGAGA